MPNLSPNVKGALLMICSMAAFTLNDACIKATGGQLHLFQLLTIRGIMATILLALLAWRLGGLAWQGTRADWVFAGLRSLAEVGAAFFFLTALLHMPLANVTAILQALPLCVTLGAALIFRERVGWRRVLAILTGFAGMLLIVRPGPEGFDTYALYAIASVGCVTVRDLATRRISARMSSMTVTLFASATVLVAAALASTQTEWVPVSAGNWMLLVASAVFILGGYSFSVLVMRVGEISFVAPFRYTGLLWALCLGWVVFGDWPDPVTLIGAASVVGSGLFMLYREAALSGGADTPAEPDRS
ncbi:MAG: DMT family transporter [Pseudomonadota bacterium]